jgi:hypothetical protein
MRTLAAGIKPPQFVQPHTMNGDDDYDDDNTDNGMHDSNDNLQYGDVLDEEKHDDSYYDHLRAVSSAAGNYLINLWCLAYAFCFLLEIGVLDAVTSAAASDIDELGIGGSDWLRQQRARERELLMGLEGVDHDDDNNHFPSRPQRTNGTNSTTMSLPVATVAAVVMPVAPLSITTNDSSTPISSAPSTIASVH